MTDTFRALCAELIETLSKYHDRLEETYHPDSAEAKELDAGFGVLERARAALAQPEPVAPTDEELDKTLFRALCDYMEQKSPFGGPTDEKQLDRAKARAVLARWGTPANNTREEN
jgi:hypothetical protein